MRFLFSLILTCFFFVVPFGSNASKVWEKQGMKSHDSQLSAPTTSDRCTNDDYFEALTQLSLCNGSETHYRPYPFASFASAVIYQKRSDQAYNGKYFVHPYSYCKRFGLRLIFPEHYYW